MTKLYPAVQTPPSNIYSLQVFHLGTIAFGSLIIAIIRTIRTILEYVEKKCQKFNNDLTR